MLYVNFTNWAIEKPVKKQKPIRHTNKWYT